MRMAIILCNSYNMGMRDLPDIYAQARGPQARGRGHIYQENPECPNAKQKQPGCKKSARPIRSHKYKRPKTLISSKAKKLNILLRIFLLE